MATTTKSPLTKEEYEAMIVDANVIVDNDTFIAHMLPDYTQVIYFKKTDTYWSIKSN